MKSRYLGIVILFSVLLLITKVNAEEFDASEVEEFPVLNRGGNEIVIDTEFDDWYLADDILVMGEDTWEPHQGGSWKNEKDLTAKLRVVYDSGNLYFALEVMDDEYVAEGGNPWENDGVQMAIDGTNEDFPPPTGLQNSTTQLYNFSIVDGWKKEAGEFQGDAEIEMRRDKTAKQTLFEWQMPTEIIAKKGTELEAGKKIAFAIIVNDSDENAKGQTGWVGWGNHTIVHGKNTEEMKALVLSSEEMAVNANGKLSTLWGKLKQLP
jgi:hypothetical protein